MIAEVSAVAAVVIVAAALRPRLRRDAPPQPDTPDRHRHSRRRGAASGGELRWDRLLDAVAAEVRGGTSLRLAVQRAAGRLCPHHHLAAPTVELAALPPTEDADLAVVHQVLTAAAAFGGATSATVQAGANLLRERAAVRAEAAAHSAQARLSARVLTAVPLVFASWSAGTSTSFRRAVMTAPGAIAATAGVALNLFGWWWMRRIVLAATR